MKELSPKRYPVRRPSDVVQEQFKAWKALDKPKALDYFVDGRQEDLTGARVIPSVVQLIRDPQEGVMLVDLLDLDHLYDYVYPRVDDVILAPYEPGMVAIVELTLLDGFIYVEAWASQPTWDMLGVNPKGLRWLLGLQDA